MTTNDAYKYQKWCNDNLILIYIVVCGSQYQIAVSKKGVETVREKKYAKTDNWSDAIRELYKQYYELNVNKLAKL